MDIELPESNDQVGVTVMPDADKAAEIVAYEEHSEVAGGSGGDEEDNGQEQEVEGRAMDEGVFVGVDGGGEGEGEAENLRIHYEEDQSPNGGAGVAEEEEPAALEEDAAAADYAAVGEEAGQAGVKRPLENGGGDVEEEAGGPAEAISRADFSDSKIPKRTKPGSAAAVGAGAGSAGELSPQNKRQRLAQRLAPSIASSAPTAVGATGADDGPVLPPETVTVMGITLLCPDEAMGMLIGRNGAALRQMREQSGAEIGLQEAPSVPPGARDRGVWLRGTATQVEAAQKIILDKLSSRRENTPAMSPAEADYKTYGDTPPDESPPEVHRTLRWVVPNAQCGALIGRGGLGIKELEESSGCRVKVSLESDLPPGRDDRIVYLTGTAAQRAAALRTIQSNPRITGHVGTPADPEAATVFIPARAMGYVLGPQQSGLEKLQRETGAEVLVPPAAELGMGTNEQKLVVVGAPAVVSKARQALAERVAAWAADRSAGGGGGRGGGPAAAGEAECSVKLAFPNELMGHMIGRQGTFVKLIKERTGASMKVMQNAPSPSLAADARPIVLVGTLSQMVQAEWLMLDRVATMPERLRQMLPGVVTPAPPSAGGGARWALDLILPDDSKDGPPGSGRRGGGTGGAPAAAGARDRGGRGRDGGEGGGGRFGGRDRDRDGDDRTGRAGAGERGGGGMRGGRDRGRESPPRYGGSRQHSPEPSGYGGTGPVRRGADRGGSPPYSPRPRGGPGGSRDRSRDRGGPGGGRIDLSTLRAPGLLNIELMREGAVMTVSDTCAGAIIGRGGNTIRRLITESEARIDVQNKHLVRDGKHEREVVVRGINEQSTAKALRLICDALIEGEEGHPRRGSEREPRERSRERDSGGGGGGRYGGGYGGGERGGRQEDGPPGRGGRERGGGDGRAAYDPLDAAPSSVRPEYAPTQPVYQAVVPPPPQQQQQPQMAGQTYILQTQDAYGRPTVVTAAQQPQQQQQHPVATAYQPAAHYSQQQQQQQQPAMPTVYQPLQGVPQQAVVYQTSGMAAPVQAGGMTSAYVMPSSGGAGAAGYMAQAMGGVIAQAPQSQQLSSAQQSALQQQQYQPQAVTGGGYRQQPGQAAPVVMYQRAPQYAPSSAYQPAPASAPQTQGRDADRLPLPQQQQQQQPQAGVYQDQRPSGAVFSSPTGAPTYQTSATSYQSPVPSGYQVPQQQSGYLGRQAAYDPTQPHLTSQQPQQQQQSQQQTQQRQAQPVQYGQQQPRMQQPPPQQQQVAPSSYVTPGNPSTYMPSSVPSSYAQGSSAYSSTSGGVYVPAASVTMQSSQQPPQQQPSAPAQFSWAQVLGSAPGLAMPGGGGGVYVPPQQQQQQQQQMQSGGGGYSPAPMPGYGAAPQQQQQPRQ